MNFADSVLHVLADGRDAFTADELAGRLRLRGADRRELPAVLALLEQEGRIVRIKGDRFCRPEAASLVTGTISFRASGSAYLLPEDAVAGDRSAEIQLAQHDTGVALHGDKVVVRVEPKKAVLQGREVRVGRVVRILQRARDTLTGALQATQVAFHVVPDDPRIVQDIIVPDPARSRLRPPPQPGDKVVVRLLEWTQRHVSPEGEIVEVLGRHLAPGAELEAILRTHRLAREFPAEVEGEAAHLPDRVQPEQLRGRQDLRGLETFTIDPDDARDFDDALSLEPLEGGRARVGVHIADVSAYVRPGTALDREARRRGNSTYLIGIVIPMLPEKLSNGLCSLLEGQDRLTKSCFLTYAPDGRLLDAEFANTVIRSRKRLSYRQAYALLQEPDARAARRVAPPAAHQTGSPGRPLAELSDEELASLQSRVKGLWAIGARLRSARLARGSLDLDMPEMKIFVDREGFAERLERIEHDESHQLVEEFMLAANEAVARRTRGHRLPSVYRVHDDPDALKLAEFRQTAAAWHLPTGDLGSRKAVVALLRALRTHPQGYNLRIQFLRSLRKAVYRPTPDGHYGLHLKDYTHFTSPIRRYADLIVHRVLAHDLSRRSGSGTSGGGRPPHSAEELASLAQHISQTEITSAEAERDHQKVKLMEFFERQLALRHPTPFPAIITDVRSHGMFIELTESMVSGFIHVSAMKDDFYVLAADGTAFVGRKTRQRFALGDRLEVVVARVDRFKRQLDFRPLPATGSKRRETGPRPPPAPAAVDGKKAPPAKARSSKGRSKQTRPSSGRRRNK